MKKLYLTNFFFVLAALISTATTAQSVPIYATSQSATSGAEITSTANGPGTYMGDHIVLAGTERYLDNIEVRMFNLASNAPFTLTMRLYTECMSTAAGCGSGPGTLIPGSEVVVDVTPTVTAGTIFSVTFPFDGLDISSEADNAIAVMINASRSDVFWVLNETITTGSAPAGESPESVVIRCGSVVLPNNGCTRAFTDAINNFSMTVNASGNLGLNDSPALGGISVYPNPSNGVFTITGNAGISKIIVFDLTGRIIKEVAPGDEREAQLDLSEFAAGNYLCKIESSAAVVTKQLIKY